MFKTYNLGMIGAKWVTMMDFNLSSFEYQIMKVVLVDYREDNIKDDVVWNNDTKL